MLRSITLLLVAAILLPAAASAQVPQVPPTVNGGQPVVVNEQSAWAKKLFSTAKIDFGVIARGSESKKTFVIRNVLSETVQITNIRTTCGCSGATVSKKLLQPKEEATVEVSMDTRQFKRRKDSNVIVQFNMPRFAEVVIPITSYIRTDVVFDPGMVRFGSVEVSKGAKRQIKVAYAGRADWRIKELKISNPHLAAKFTEKARQGGRIDYVIDVMLKPTAPIGRLRDLVTLVTDDASNPYVPLLVEASVESDITVIPGSQYLGVLSPGQKIQTRVVVKGKRRFEIEKVESMNGSKGFQYQRPTRTTVLHRVPMTLTAPNRPGKFAEKFSVWIAGRKKPVYFTVTGEILGNAILQ